MKQIRDIKRILRRFDRNPGAIPEDDQFVGGVLAPFLLIDSEYHLVFEKRAQNIRQPGEISFPGGGFDDKHDRSTKDTAVRETMEELGIPSGRIRAYRRIGTVVTGHGATVDVYPGILRITGIDELNPAESEVAEVFSVPFSYFVRTEPERYTAHSEVRSFYTDETGREVYTFPARELGLPERYHRSWGEREHILFVYSWDKHQIWGMTARIVKALVQAYRDKR
jgi:8-oxo-dGTP pyrophosphatase MutT (NUDIX family)